MYISNTPKVYGPIHVQFPLLFLLEFPLSILKKGGFFFEKWEPFKLEFTLLFNRK